MIRIDKERTWVFSPVNNIVLKAEIKGYSSEEQIKEAIHRTADHYEMLHQKIVFDNDGNAYYDTTEMFELVIKDMNGNWEDKIREQEKIPFAIDKGELLRIFYQVTQSGISLLILAHHIAGDGMSFAYFLQDILRTLSGRKLEYKKLALFDMTRLPRESRLRFPTTWLLNSLNKKWKKTGKTFEIKEYYSMFEKYWNNHESLFETYSFKNEDYDALCKYAKENSVTVNSLITAALIYAADELSDVGMAVSIRESGYTGMGNYATGISIKYQYNEKLNLVENTKKVQNLIYNKIKPASKKYFLLQFMGNIEPTLMDAVYFEACGDYKNKTAGMFSKMFGYHGNPKGISITNLTKLPIDVQYGDYEITDFLFIPPLVLNAQRIIGIASIGRKMTVTLHLNHDSQAELHHEFFYRGMKYLKDAITQPNTTYI
jgi:hypothetical protein